jgi:quercetin dioxygenase-like cupin family protein
MRLSKSGTMGKIKNLTLLTIGLGIGLNSEMILAAASGPKEHKSIDVGLLEELPEQTLKTTIGLEGYTMRMRWVTVLPGGQIAEHSHADRPGIVTMVDGEWVEGKPSGEDTFHAAGYGTFPENENTVHWVYNRSDKPATALVCDLAKTE